jgi:hypothetical protein
MSIKILPYSPREYSKYKNSPIQKMERANFILYVNADGTIHIGKNRYNGVTGPIHNTTGVKILAKLLVKIAFNNTCIIFQESLKKDLYKVLEKHKVLEGEENDKIRRSSFSDGA